MAAVDSAGSSASCGDSSERRQARSTKRIRIVTSVEAHSTGGLARRVSSAFDDVGETAGVHRGAYANPE